MIGLRFVVLSLAILMISCHKEKIENPFVERDPKQVTLIYFAGQDLNRYYDVNIIRAKSAVANGDMGEYGDLYYFLPTTPTDATLVELSYDGHGGCVERVVQSYDDIASLSKEAVVRVIADVKSDEGEDVMASARMNLIWGSHGTGWIHAETSGRSSLFSVEASCSDDDYGMGEYIPTRFVGLNPSDSAQEGYMNIEDLTGALEQSETHFGYILFDSCLMSSIEALYRLKDFADYFVVSPAEVPGAGFPYATVIPALFRNNGAEFDLQGVCQAYYNYYKYASCTVAVCVAEELENLATAMASLSLSTLSADQLKCIQRYDSLSSGVFYDFMDYVTVAGAYGSNNYRSFLDQFNATFPVDCRFYTPTMISNFGRNTRWTSSLVINSCSGVTTSQPSLNSRYNIGWSEEPWAVAIGE